MTRDIIEALKSQGFHSRKEGMMCYQNLLSSMERGVERKERPQKVICHSVNNETNSIGFGV